MTSPAASSSPDEMPEVVARRLAIAREYNPNADLSDNRKWNNETHATIRWFADAYERVIRERDEARSAVRNLQAEGVVAMRLEREACAQIAFARGNYAEEEAGERVAFGIMRSIRARAEKPDGRL